MRVLFLDFDGVLHPLSEAVIEPGVPIDELIRVRDLFRWLPKLADALEPHPDVKIVVHSTWRYFTDDAGLRQLLGHVGNRFVGSAPPGPRWGVIEWVLKDNPQIADFRVLDDAHEEFPDGLEMLIRCDPEFGIAEARVVDELRSWLES